MKSNPVPSFYFSAYPLKALKLSDEEMQSYQQPSPVSTLKVQTNVKIWGMVNPYDEKMNVIEIQKTKDIDQLTEDMDIGWYNNYE